jgi:hypothetical protein
MMPDTNPTRLSRRAFLRDGSLVLAATANGPAGRSAGLMEHLGLAVAPVVAEGDPVLRDVPAVRHQAAVGDVMGVQGHKLYPGAGVGRVATPALPVAPGLPAGDTPIPIAAEGAGTEGRPDLLHRRLF